MRHFLNAMLAALTIAALSLSAAQAQTYMVTDLGSLGGATTPLGINASGQVTGASVASSGSFHAFIWTPSSRNGTTGTIRDLGLPKNFNSATGHAINDLGQVAGEGSGNNIPHALLWTGGSIVSLVSGSGQSAAYAINNYGEVTGGAATGTNGAFDTFLWKPAVSNGTKGTMTDLKLPGGTGGVYYGINSFGTVVNANFAFIWTPSTANGTTGSSISAPWQPGAINDSGQTTGYAAYTWMGSDGVPRSSSQAAWWDPALGVQTLGFPVDTVLPAGSGWNGGYSTWINNSGIIVGWAQARDLTAYPFPITVNTVWMWTAATGVHDLNANPTIQSSGWVLTGVNGVNSVGQIVGVGTFNGQSRGFLLTPQ